MKYSIRASGYKDYISILLGDTEIIQIKTNAFTFSFAEQELRHMVDSINTIPIAIDSLRSLRGMEAWIGDREMKELFQNKVYSAIDAFDNTSYGHYINQKPLSVS